MVLFKHGDKKVRPARISASEPGFVTVGNKKGERIDTNQTKQLVKTIQRIRKKCEANYERDYLHWGKKPEALRGSKMQITGARSEGHTE